MRRIVPIFILLLAAFLRFHAIESQSLWHDEGNSLRLAERTISDLIEATSRDIHPPGYYLALKFWIGFMGTTELGLRSLSAFWGILTVAAVYGLGQQLYGGTWAGVIAALLVTVNPFAVYYAQEARMYAQLGALSLLSLWIFICFLQNTQKYSRIAWGIGLLLVNLAGLYTHYTYPFTMMVQGFFVILWWRTVGLPFFLLNLVTLAAFLPWLPTAYDQITIWPTTGDATPLLDRLGRVFTILIYGHTAKDLNIIGYAVPIILLLLVVIASMQKPELRWRIGLPLTLCLLSMAALLGSGAYREANLKFLIPAQAALAVVFGSSVIVLGWRFGFVPIVIGFLVLANTQNLDALYNDSAYARSNYRRIAETIVTNPRPDDAIILNAPNQQEVFSYYYTGEASIFPLPAGLGGDDSATRSAVEEIVTHHRRIFLVLWGQHERDPNGIVESTLSENAFEVSRRWYNDVELAQYVILESPPSEPAHITNMQFGDKITLVGFALSSETLQTGIGDVLGVTLFWKTTTPLDHRYKISVQVLDSFGRLASQHDSEPANGRAITTTWQPQAIVIDNHGLVMNPELTTGIYTLIVVVYDINNPDNRLQPANDDPNAIFTLGILTLE